MGCRNNLSHGHFLLVWLIFSAQPYLALQHDILMESNILSKALQRIFSMGAWHKWHFKESRSQQEEQAICPFSQRAVDWWRRQVCGTMERHKYMTCYNCKLTKFVKHAIACTNSLREQKFNACFYRTCRYFSNFQSFQTLHNTRIAEMNLCLTNDWAALSLLFWNGSGFSFLLTRNDGCWFNFTCDKIVEYEICWIMVRYTEILIWCWFYMFFYSYQ